MGLFGTNWIKKNGKWFNPLMPSTMITKALFGIGEPGAGFVGKILPGVEKITRMVEEKEPQPIKEYVKWFKEQEQIRKGESPEQLQYLKEHPERVESIKRASLVRIAYGGDDYAIAKGIITPKEAELFPVTQISPFVTGTLADISKMSAKQLAPIMIEQAKVYFQKQAGINIDKITKSQVPQFNKVFYKLAHKMHPDKPTGSEEAFKELNNFYQIAMAKYLKGSEQYAIFNRPSLIQWFKDIFAKQVKPEPTKLLKGEGIIPEISKQPTRLPIPSELQPLAKEAMKYGSAEEFISSLTITEARSITDRTLYKWSPKYALQSFYDQAKGIPPLAQKGVVPAVEGVEPIPITERLEIKALPKPIKGRRYIRGELVIPGDNFVMKGYLETKLTPKSYLEREKIRKEMEIKRMVKIEREEKIKTIPISELTRKEIQQNKIREIAGKLKTIEIKNLPLEYKTQIQGILSNVDLKFRTGKTLAKRNALKSYVEQLRTDGISIEISDELIDIAEKTPLNNMTPEQLGMLNDEVLRLVHLGQYKNRLIKVQAKKNVDNLTKELSDHLLKGKFIKEPKVVTKEAVKEAWLERKKRKIVGFFQRNTRIERMLNELDDYYDYLTEPEKTLMQNTFYRPVNEAKDIKIRGVMQVQAEFQKMIQNNNINLAKVISEKQQFAPDVIVTPSEKIGVYLSSLNEDNLLHVKYGNKFDDELIQRIIKSLTKEERAIANFLRTYWKEGAPAISKVRTLIEGRSLGVVEDYFPIKLEWAAEPEVNMEQSMAKEEVFRFTSKWASSKIAKSFLKERSHKAMQPVKLDALEIFWGELGKVEHYKAFAPVVRDLQLLIHQPQFRKALDVRYGKEAHKILNQWLKQVADYDPLRVTSESEKWIKTARVNSSIAVLGLKIVIGFKQTASFFNGAAEIGMIPSIKGLFTSLTSPKVVMQQIKELSPQIYERSFEREIAEEKLMRRLDQRILNKITPKEVWMFFTTLMDRITVNTIWKGGFDDYYRKTGDIKKSADYADRVIRRTQPFFDIKDLAEVYRSGEGMKVITVFTNQLNQNFNYYRHDIYGKYRVGRIPFSQVIRRTLLAFVIPALIIGWMNRSKPARNLKELVGDVVGQALASFPLIGKWLAGGLRGFTDSGIVAAEVLERLSREVYNASKSEWKKFLKEIPELAGYALGIPVGGPKNLFMALFDLATGKTDDWWRLIFSKYAREKAKEKPTTKPGLPSLPKLPKLPTLPKLPSL